LAQCQFKVTGWGIMFICGMVLRFSGTLKPGLTLDQLQQIGQARSYKANNLLKKKFNLFTHTY